MGTLIYLAGIIVLIVPSSSLGEEYTTLTMQGLRLIFGVSLLMFGVLFVKTSDMNDKLNKVNKKLDNLLLGEKRNKDQ